MSRALYPLQPAVFLILIWKNMRTGYRKKFPNRTINIYPIRNDFFGETITVSGLITGQDLIGQLKEKKESGVKLGDTLLIPGNMLRSGEQVFLDDLTVEDARRALEMEVTAVESGGQDLIDAILNVDYAIGKRK